MSDLISREEAVNALWKALYEYEDKTEKQFQESEDLDVGDWMLHRIFVQNMSDIDIQTILDLPSAEQQWTPVSEGLPKKSSLYLVTVKTDGVPYFEREFPNGFVYLSAYDAVTMHWGYGGTNVIAWMPVPKPYKGGK